MMFRHDQSELIRGESPQRVYTRARAVLLSVCVAMLIGVGASVPLWSSDVERRSELVTVPVFAFMGTLPAWFELVLLLVWLVSVFVCCPAARCQHGAG
jgi:ABC-type proline/glycine betaine transport system permease subunit